LKVLLRQPRQLGGEHVFGRRLIQVDWGRPTGLTGGKTVEVLLYGQQVANRIPAREGHERIVARGS